MRRSKLITGFVVIALTSFAAARDVCGEITARAGLDSRIPSMALTRDRQKQEAYSSQPDWLDFKARHGEQWKVLWRESTGAPHRVFSCSVAAAVRATTIIARINSPPPAT